MSFAFDLKTELAQSLPQEECCRKAFLYGVSLFGKSFNSRDISINTENEEIANSYEKLMDEFFAIECIREKTPGGKWKLSVPSFKERLEVLHFFGHDKNEVTLKINRSNFDCDNCEGAFFAGAFISCGTISSPEKDYHLEFVVPYLNLSKSLVKLLSEFDLNAKTTNRKGYSVIYFKESESIEECLYRMGAHSAAFEIMNIKVVKDFRNKANRVANCENANINRIVNAVAPQLCAIQKIEEKQGLDSLTDELREIALLRLENPEASLQELADMTTLSRSGVNHRLKKIEKIAEEL